MSTVHQSVEIIYESSLPPAEYVFGKFIGMSLSSW